jgi:hypothetical protein
MLGCTTASRLPTMSVSAAMTEMAVVHVSPSAGSATMRMRSRAAKPPTLEPTDMKAVTTVGEPSYTSGVHIWKGTAAILKPKPTRISAAPATSSSDTPAMPPAALTAETIPGRAVVPVAP